MEVPLLEFSSNIQNALIIIILDRNYSSVLSLVDLAGSERVAESKTVGERFKETVCINSALSSLRNVIRGQLQGQKILQKVFYYFCKILLKKMQIYF